MGPPETDATNLLPSADEATADQETFVGALVSIQVWARAGLAAVNKPYNTGANDNGILILFIGFAM